MASEKNFHLKIVSRQGDIFNGEVGFISSVNEEGEFDILPQHANFISLLKEKITYKPINDEVRELKFDTALLRMKDNDLEIYLGIGNFGSESQNGKR